MEGGEVGERDVDNLPKDFLKMSFNYVAIEVLRNIFYIFHSLMIRHMVSIDFLYHSFLSVIKEESYRKSSRKKS